MRICYNKENGNYTIEDMNSKHGVLVNGIRITADTVLSEGDYIKAGKTILLFTMEDFASIESALHHFKKIGERQNPTMIDR